MGLFDLGKRLWDITREEGQNLWEKVEPEFQDFDPRWDKVKDELRSRGHSFRYQLRAEMRKWLEEELRYQEAQWRSLLGNDPELERAYQVLQLPYGTAQADVKQQWRSLLKETHPDLHMHDPTEHALATQRSQKLTAAYHQIIKAFDEGILGH